MLQLEADFNALCDFLIGLRYDSFVSDRASSGGGIGGSGSSGSSVSSGGCRGDDDDPVSRYYTYLLYTSGNI